MWQNKKETLLRAEDIETLESYIDAFDGYFGKMAAYLDEFVANGIAQQSFTEEEVRADLEVALWYSYAWNNIDTYESYYSTMQWMPYSECHAQGCGIWYYRYACALLYCGKLEMALEYAERGVKEEPDYPWGWLTVAKLRSHFGDEQGALEAVDRGLALVPGDYEFTVLQQEIIMGYSLEQMEYHYIHEENDIALLEGQLDDSGDTLGKKQSVAGIVCNQQALAELQELLHISEWEADAPYCAGIMLFQGERIRILFCMNEAAVSKLQVEWMQEKLREIGQEAPAIQLRLREDGYGECRLELLMVNRNQTVDLVFYNPETEQSFTLRQKEQTDADMEETDGFAFPQLMKLYQKREDGLHYAECWYDEGVMTEEGTMTEHTGMVGQTGEVRKLPCNSPEAYQDMAAQFYDTYNALGYEFWQSETADWIVAQFPVQLQLELDGRPVADDALRTLQQEAGSALNESLGWNGAGHVDGWEVGSLLHDSERYVLNLYCLTVNADLALGIMLQALEARVDCSHLKLAVMKADEDNYQLAYSADFSEDFSL